MPGPSEAVWGLLRQHGRDRTTAVGDTQLLLWVTDWLILQSPATPIFEGDPLVLRCQAWQDWPLTEVTFYRDGSALGPPRPNKEFSIAVAREADSGHYHCSAIFQGPGPRSPETASSVPVTVQGERSRRSLWRAGKRQRPASVSGGAGSPQPRRVHVLLALCLLRLVSADRPRDLLPSCPCADREGLTGSSGTFLRWFVLSRECGRDSFPCLSPRTVSSPSAQSHTLRGAPRGRRHDPELPDKAAPAEVSCPPPLLLLQGWPGRA